MAILNPVLKPIVGPTITFVLLTEKTRTVSGSFTYLRTDGSSIFRPDGTSIYTRP